MSLQALLGVVRHLVIERIGVDVNILLISLAALPYGDVETASGGTRQHQNASPEASSRYSHSFTLVCCRAIPVNSSWVIGLDHLAAEPLHVLPCGRLGQNTGQRSKLFGSRGPAGQKPYAVTITGRIVAGDLALNQGTPYFRYSSKNSPNFSNGMTSI